MTKFVNTELESASESESDTKWPESKPGTE